MTLSGRPNLNSPRGSVMRRFDALTGIIAIGTGVLIASSLAGTAALTSIAHSQAATPWPGFADVVDKITVPTLVVYSLDDPFIRVLPATREKLRANRNIRLIETAHGGHCGFLAAPNGYDGRWAEQQVVNFVREFA